MTTDKNLIADDITSKIIGAIYEVHSILGPGFLEAVYQKALVKELLLRGLFLEEQKELRVLYKGEEVGLYFPDILVENQVVIELKAVDALKPVHQAQLINYLKATGMRVGLLVNFGSARAEFKRMVL
jgi:GxxExxY protein